MASLIQESVDEDAKYLLNKLKIQDEQIKALLDSRLYNFEQLVKTGDVSFLVMECGQNKGTRGTQKIKRTTRVKRGVLDDITGAFENVKIKQEKVSILSSDSSVENMPSVPNIINEAMPPPKELPRKRAIKVEPVDLPKRSTRTRKKPDRFEDIVREPSISRSSDVVVQNTTITKINLTDDSDSTDSKSENMPEMAARPKRTRTIRKGTAAPVEAVTNKDVLKTSEQPEETAISTFEPKTGDNTNQFVNDVQPALLNCTVVIEKPNVVHKPTEEAPTTPQKQNKTKKEIFSPFEKVSTKDKVKAFEKLAGPEHVPSPTLNTGTRKRTGKVSQKPCTPMTSKAIPKMQTTTRVNRIINGQDSLSANLISTKSQSALKASQAEFREREKLRLEKEKKALEKRDALMLALMEEKKRKREERQIKVQQQREMIEKEKQKTLEGKYKKVLTDNSAKKRKIDEIKHHEKGSKFPIYMLTRPPLLPTGDCYDSDHEEYKKQGSYKPPQWTTSHEVRKMQLIMLQVGETIKNTFFSRQLHSPNLQEIFEMIDPRKLKRNSSAVWRKPPRYTLLLESSGAQFSEDDDDY